MYAGASEGVQARRPALALSTTEKEESGGQRAAGRLPELLFLFSQLLSSDITRTTTTTNMLPSDGSRRDGGGPGRLELNAANNVELRANAQNILSIIHDAWPKTTSDAYEPK